MRIILDELAQNILIHRAKTRGHIIDTLPRDQLDKRREDSDARAPRYRAFECVALAHKA